MEIRTKLSLGDRAYVLYHDTIYSFIIDSISAKANFRMPPTIFYFNAMGYSWQEKDCFATEKELLESL